MKPLPHDTKRLMIAAIILLLIVFAIVFLTILAPPTVGAAVQSRWTRFALINAFVAICEIKAYRKIRRKKTFWMILGGSFALCAGLWALAAQYGISMASTAIAAGAQFAVTAILTYAILHVGPERIRFDL